MKEIFDLSLMYYKMLIRKRFFILYVTIIIIISFFLIPASEAGYVTFYFGNNYAAPNEFWIGNISAIFTNVSVFLILIFIMIGEKSEMIRSNNYVYELTSTLSRNKIFTFKIAGLFLVSMLFVFILNASIIFINIRQINLFYYFVPLIYFTVPFLFLACIICFLLEYYINNSALKYFLYYTLFLLTFFSGKVFDIIGINELGIYLSGNNLNSDTFGLGYLRKSNRLHEVVLSRFTSPLFIGQKILLIVLGFFLIYISKFFSVNFSNKVSADNNFQKVNILQTSGYKFIEKSPSVRLNLSVLNLLRKDFFLFSNCITRANLLMIMILWTLLFFVIRDFNQFILPLLLICCLFTNDFLYKHVYYNIEYFEKIAPFSNFRLLLSKFIVIFSLYAILLLPYLLKADNVTVFTVLLYFIILAMLQVLLVVVMKSKLLTDVVMIVLFA